ncbi:MAG: penicillin acylase family protein [Actinomycetota bacterium]
MATPSLRCPRHWTAVATLATLLALAGPPTADAQKDPVLGYRELDHSVVALNVLPPGQGRHLNAAEFLQAQTTGVQPPHNTDQSGLYDGLIKAAPGLTDESLTRWFKDASFGVKPGDEERRYSPREGLVVIRDKAYGVPHVYGRTRSDVMFGAGYVTGEDRLFMIDVLRHMAKGRTSEFLGASESNLAADRAQRKLADYTEEELDAMSQRLVAVEPVLGAQVVQDVKDFSAGVSAYISETQTDPGKLPAEYAALQLVPEPWKPGDSVALNSLIGAGFSLGGGGQLINAAVLHKLTDKGYSYEQARAILADLRFPDDPEAPTSTTRPFRFNTDLGPVDPQAVALPDDPKALLQAASVAFLPPSLDGPLGPIPLVSPRPASNALLVGAAQSASGRPFAVMGPQVGYYSPEIFMEIDMHGPGVHARGGAFPGISMYVLIGRGTNYGWSATTAVGDHNDIRAVRLCDPQGGEPAPDSRYYLDDGTCRQMYVRTDTWQAKPSLAGPPDPSNPQNSITVSMTTERTRHGIVQARGNVAGKPAAFVRQRSTYGAEVDSALAYVEAMDPDKIRSLADLQRAFSRFNFSFNWHLVDGRSAGFYTAGAYPKLAPGVDPDLPFWGDSRWDWRGFLSYEEHPQSVDPPQGYITNWNNKQAPSFRSSDDWFAYGPVQRKQLLEDGVAAALAGDGKVGRAELVRAMEYAATRDLRGAKVLPYMLEAVDTAGDPRLDRAMELLRSWNALGAHRRDLDGDGNYDQAAAAALMDAWWARAVEAVFRPALGEAFDLVPLGRDDRPANRSWLAGWSGQMQKDLRSVLGLPVQEKFSRGYCGNGDRAACRQVLLDSLNAAVSALEQQYGQDPATWDAQENEEYIQFSAVGLQDQKPIPWQNRPTFQQVLEFESPPRPVVEARLPATGGSPWAGYGTAAGVAAVMGAGAVGRRRRSWTR